MPIAIIITLIALVTALIAVVAARDVITDKTKPGWNKLNGLGYVVIICAILMVIGPMIQYFVQGHQDEQKESVRKAEDTKHDSLLRAEYRKSVEQIRQDFTDKNNQTLTVIGQTLAKYGLKLDTSQQKITMLIQNTGMQVALSQAAIKSLLWDDSIKMKTTLADVSADMMAKLFYFDTFKKNHPQTWPDSLRQLTDRWHTILSSLLTNTWYQKHTELKPPLETIITKLDRLDYLLAIKESYGDAVSWTTQIFHASIEWFQYPLRKSEQDFVVKEVGKLNF